MDKKELIKQFTDTLPHAEIIVGYGSGIKNQSNDKGLNKQLDLILVVENKEKWFQEVFKTYPNVYNKLNYKILSMSKSKFTDIDYLSYLPFKNQMFKVGIISKDCALNDLIQWKNFNLAGRLQKDVEMFKSKECFDRALKINRLNALKIALLLLDNNFTEQNLYETLCSLSFISDLRNIFKIENPNKIPNIVNGSINELRTIYNNLNKDYFSISKNNLTINYNAIRKDLDLIPTQLLLKMEKFYYNDFSKENLVKIRKIILSFLRKKNLMNSTVQPLRGIMLNGFSKSYNYLNDKLVKRKSEIE